MTLQNTAKLSKHLCRILKVPEIQWTIARTAKGNISLGFNENTEDFVVYLDSIPLSTKSMLDDENNIELKNMIEKYYFAEKSLEIGWNPPVSETTTLKITPVESEIVHMTVKKGGRPKGSKNVKKADK